jgi:hypothetical protein
LYSLGSGSLTELQEDRRPMLRQYPAKHEILGFTPH